jgi:hypothetical protein
MNQKAKSHYAFILQSVDAFSQIPRYWVPLPLTNSVPFKILCSQGKCCVQAVIKETSSYSSPFPVKTMTQLYTKYPLIFCVTNQHNESFIHILMCFSKCSNFTSISFKSTGPLIFTIFKRPYFATPYIVNVCMCFCMFYIYIISEFNLKIKNT